MNLVGLSGSVIVRAKEILFALETKFGGLDGGFLSYGGWKMILSGLKIKMQVQNRNIQIDPFDEKYLNPNSYNLRLFNELMVYTDDVLDMRKPLNTETIFAGKFLYAKEHLDLATFHAAMGEVWKKNP